MHNVIFFNVNQQEIILAMFCVVLVIMPLIYTWQLG